MKEFFKENEERLLQDLIGLIQIPGIAGAAEGEGNPFGKAVTESLRYIMDLAGKMGFDVCNYDNYAAEISIGQGEHVIGILCHADVVDAGDGWETDPFQGVVKDGKLYGRGSIDDKGPLISCLYGMKYIQERSLLPKGYRIKLIVGTDEEENWESIDYYLKQNPELPELSIVPDGNFPLIFCEKGLVNFEFLFPAKSTQVGETIEIITLSGGERANVVPAHAMCKLGSTEKNHDFEKESAIIKKQIETLPVSGEVSCEPGLLTIEVQGKAAHAMTPEKGVNAFSYLMKILAALADENGADCGTVKLYNQYIGTEYDGKSLGCKCGDEDSGDLTVNIGTAELKDGRLRCGVNLRYPVTYRFDEVVSSIMKIADQEQIQVKQGVCMDPVYFEKESRLVTTLMEVYKECTGDQTAEPIAIGGATYARAIPNAVAFGPVFPDQEELAHEANEFFAVADYRRITEIYVKALLRLCAKGEQGQR